MAPFSRPPSLRLLQKIFVVAALSWCIGIAASLLWNFSIIRNQTRQIAFNVAQAYFNKDLAFRLWGASHGGVYVPISSEMQPNPYLSYVSDRDVTTTSGKRLTLVNPAYMIRQMMSKFSALTGVSGHLTSLKLLNPINEPDDWEKRALNAFENGVEEVTEFTSLNNEPYLRLIRPYITRVECLKCHRDQGYKEGDVRGATSISIPMAPYLAAEEGSLRTVAVTHMAILLIGLAGIFFCARLIGGQIRRHISMEEDLEKQYTFTKTIIESLTHPFYVINADTHEIILANSAAGLQSTSGHTTCHKLAHQQDTPCDGDEHPCPLRLVKESGKTVTVEHLHHDPKGNARLVEVQCFPIFDDTGRVSEVIEYSYDITERKQAEEEKLMLQTQLQQAQKMEAIGRLSGGIAHDFNNLLTSILGYSEILLLQMGGEHALRSKVEAIHKAGHKATGLTRQLLAFSRKQIVETKVINPNTLICDMTKMLSRLIGEDIELHLDLSPSLQNIKADAAQIEQIIMNLAVNARDAMPAGGRLCFFTANKQIPAGGPLSGEKKMAAGNYVLLTVSDTGSGMSADIMDKIFDPFFTTKQAGQGTGLGLATVYGIVKQHDAHIEVQSKPDNGTSFSIYFPACDEHIEESVPEERAKMVPGNETVLLVEDDLSIRKLVLDTLEPLGYSVIEAMDGEAAIHFCESDERKIDLLLTDVVMPGINGRQLANRLKSLQPQMPIIFMSGYTYDIIAGQNELDSREDFIGKPLIPSRLAAKIRRVLDKKS